MRILIATGLYPPQVGGPATHTKMLEAGLPSHGVEVDVLPFFTVEKYPPVLRHLLFAVKLFLRAGKAQVVFAQDPFSCGLPAYIAARMRRLPYIVRIPGDYAWEQSRERLKSPDSVEEFQHKKYTFAIELMRSVEKFVVRHADATVVPSQFLQAIVAPWGPRRLLVVQNGVAMPQQVVAPANPPPQPFIVSASRLVRGKGFEELIALMQELPEWRLVIVGSGPLQGELVQLVAKQGLESRVLFTGAVTREEMFGWYKAATVFVLNTEFETFSFQVLESMLTGAATIATAVGGIPEVLQSGTEGSLVPPHNAAALTAAIQSVLQEPGVWQERKQAAAKKAQLLSSERSVASFAQLFKDICR